MDLGEAEQMLRHLLEAMRAKLPRLTTSLLHTLAVRDSIANNVVAKIMERFNVIETDELSREMQVSL